jgi:probable rRNA maturation factor
VHRNIDRATDVLSFPLFEYDEEGYIIEDEMEVNPEGDLLLGDIVISLEKAAEQAEEYGHSEEEEREFLIVHGLLHLFGYDHMNEQDEKEMREKEKEIRFILRGVRE